MSGWFPLVVLRQTWWNMVKVQSPSWGLREVFPRTSFMKSTSTMARSATSLLLTVVF